MAKILVVEDDEATSQMVEDALVSCKWVVDTVGDGESARTYLETYVYELIILDWMLPGTQGLDICRSFRQRGGRTPILFLTGKNSTLEKTMGLDSGAEDYLTKPFDLDELIARVRAILRRSYHESQEPTQTAGLSINPSNYTVTLDGASVQLQPAEFAMLQYLAKHPNRILAPEELWNRSRTETKTYSEDGVRTTIKSLRQKLGPRGKQMIRSEYGQGYRFCPSGSS